MQNRYQGCLVGLAVGDALGTTVEFKAPGTFTPMTAIVGRGPFGLGKGQWTDDTSMALCLAESLCFPSAAMPIKDCSKMYTLQATVPRKAGNNRLTNNLLSHLFRNNQPKIPKPTWLNQTSSTFRKLPVLIISAKTVWSLRLAKSMIKEIC